MTIYAAVYGNGGVSAAYMNEAAAHTAVADNNANPYNITMRVETFEVDMPETLPRNLRFISKYEGYRGDIFGNPREIYTYSRLYARVALAKADPMWTAAVEAIAQRKDEKFFIEDFVIATDDAGAPFLCGPRDGKSFCVAIRSVRLYK